MKVLLIEDEEHKASDLTGELLARGVRESDLVRVISVRQAVLEVTAHSFDLVIVDMGIINAAVVVARALETYCPSVVAMSGICAGIDKNAELGQLLVADFAWEYQSGKWLREVFAAEPYQVSIPQGTRLSLSKLLEDKDLLPRLERHFTGSVRPSKMSPAKLAPFASGSAVIASKKRLDAVKNQHRKVAGLDMEVFGFHRAVELSGQPIHAFSAKVVVDKANEAKGDELHEYGCLISAAFTIEALIALLSS